MKKILGLGLLVLTILFTGCSSDDNDNTNSGSGSVSAKINGTEWKPSTIINVSLIKLPGEGQRFDISAKDNSQMLSIACSSEYTSANTMPLRQYNFTDDDAEESDAEVISDALFVNTYLIDGNTYTEHLVKSGKITITSMDAEKKTVSGTFSFRTEKAGILQNKIVTPEVVEVKEGVFNNLTYKVVEAK
ncbi:DUF6252 family protein [Flavobacterium gyeonganense]|uniref:DUF6252 family protein n=1 Tax=Flavobacterium gyeonganense TaxID=1310418 RepID=A0ABV5H7W9_9FLAO|nr:DUF6252 family protein [Flavobacterium gyeonganense]